MPERNFGSQMGGARRIVHPKSASGLHRAKGLPDSCRERKLRSIIRDVFETINTAGARFNVACAMGEVKTSYAFGENGRLVVRCHGNPDCLGGMIAHLLAEAAFANVTYNTFTEDIYVPWRAVLGNFADTLAQHADDEMIEQLANDLQDALKRRRQPNCNRSADELPF